MLLRVPGLGTRAVERIVQARRHGKLRMADVARLTTGLKRLRPFMIAVDHQPARLIDRQDLREIILAPARQALCRQPSLFA
jgi:predicted DNA-binding helix-hairpin-helix protein